MSVVSCGYQSSSYFENGFITKFLKLIISHFHFEANMCLCLGIGMCRMVTLKFETSEI